MGHLRVHIAAPESLAEAFAGEFAAAADHAIARTGRFVVAIPGGSVAEAFLPRLPALGHDWNLVHLFWCDERGVADTDSASNAGRAAHLLAGTPAESAVRHPMPANASDLGAAAERYAADLALTLRGDQHLDLVLLGMGVDGHVASLFPGHPALEETRTTVLPIFDSPKPPSRRMTLNLSVLAEARLVVIAAFGAPKATAVREAVTATGSAPGARLVAAADRVLLLVDEGAASLLGPDRRA